MLRWSGLRRYPDVPPVDLAALERGAAMFASEEAYKGLEQYLDFPLGDLNAAREDFAARRAANPEAYERRGPEVRRRLLRVAVDVKVCLTCCRVVLSGTPLQRDLHS